MIVDKGNQALSINRQCKLLDVHRSGLYYQKKSKNQFTLELMEAIDKEYTLHPFRGVVSMTTYLRKDLGYVVNKKRIRRLFKLMEISAMAPGPHTSRGIKEHKKYPYLLRNLTITHRNQVWAIDITYIPIKGGYMYLIAIIDLHTRYVLHWALSNTMEAQWCATILEETIAMHGKPEIFNSDQGSQFTSDVFINVLKTHEIAISMDGKGRATDNIFIERLWRSVKYEDVYINAYESGIELYRGLKEYFEFYNFRRRHSSINDCRPADLYMAA